MNFRIPPSRNTAVITVFWVLAAVHLFIPLYNHFVFRSSGFDYAVYNFAFFDYAHLRISPCPLYSFPTPATFWQDHFSLLLLLLSPLYWLLTPILGTYTLIVVQWLLVVAGAWFTFRFVARRTTGELLPTLAVACYFLLHGRFTAHRTDVNFAIMAASLVPAMLYYFDAARWKHMWAVVAVLFVSREDVSLWLAFLGLAFAIAYRAHPAQRRQALRVAVVSLVFFVVCLTVIIPVFLNDENRTFSHFQYKALGETPLAALKYVFHDPVQVVRLLFINHSGDGYYDNVKRDFYLVYLASGAIVLFFRPALLIAFIPLLAKKMLNDSPVRWGLDTYYAIEVASLLPALMFMVVAGIRRVKLRHAAGVAVLLATVSTTLWVMHAPPDSYRFPGTEKYNVFSREFYDHGQDLEEIRRVLAMVPPHAEVSASGYLTPHLAFRERILYFPVKTEKSYVAVLRSTNAFPLRDMGYHLEVGKLLADKRWERIYESRSIILFKGPAAGN